MDTLQKTLIQELEKYAGKAFNGYSYLMMNSEQTVFSIISIGKVREQEVINLAIAARIENNLIQILRDIHSKPLIDALLQAGIPRSQIILAYAGEAIPESA